MGKVFKKSSIVDTLVNVGIGGGANVAMDYLYGLIPEETFANVQNPTMIKNLIKVGVGVLGGSMVSGKSAKYLRPAVDGIATVGASELISGLISGSDDANTGGGSNTGAGGVAFMGRAGRRMGQRGFRSVRGAGNVGTVPFMG